MLAWKSGRRFPPGAPAAFLDRDGTLNRNLPGDYITSPSQIKLYSSVPAALKLLAAKGYRIVVITNQSGIGRGYMTALQSGKINLKLVGDLKAAGASVDAVYYCPHKPEDRCTCRKPGAGLLREAETGLKLDIAASFVAGDKRSDLALAAAAGIRGYLVLTGGGRKAAGPRAKGYRDLLSVAIAVPDLAGNRGRRKK